MLAVILESPAGERSVAVAEVPGTADVQYSPAVDLQAAAQAWDAGSAGAALRAHAAQLGCSVLYATRPRSDVFAEAARSASRRQRVELFGRE